MPVGKIPVDYDSIIYSQRQLNEYFSEGSSGKRLVITQKYGRECLELKKASDLSIWDTILAFFFGSGPASFKNVMAFCADRCLSHKKLKVMMQTYNEQHQTHKNVDNVVQQVLQKHVSHPLVRAAKSQNMEVLPVFKKMYWQEARSLFINENQTSTGLFLDICNPEKQHAEVVDFFVKFISKAPLEDQQIIYEAKDIKGRNVYFLLGLQMTNLSQFVKDMIGSRVAIETDNNEETVLMRLFEDQYSLLQLQSLLKYRELFKLDEGKNPLFYCYRGSIDRLVRQKISAFIAAIKESSPDQQEKLVTEFLSYRDESGDSIYQAFIKKGDQGDLRKADRVMTIKKAFTYQDDGWVEGDK